MLFEFELLQAHFCLFALHKGRPEMGGLVTSFIHLAHMPAFVIMSLMQKIAVLTVTVLLLSVICSEADF